MQGTYRQSAERKRIGVQRKHIGTKRKRIGHISLDNSHNCNVIFDIFQCDHLNKHIDKDKQYFSLSQLVLQNIFLRNRLNKNIDKCYSKQDYLFDVFQRARLNKNVDKDKNQNIPMIWARAVTL